MRSDRGLPSRAARREPSRARGRPGRGRASALAVGATLAAAAVVLGIGLVVQSLGAGSTLVPVASAPDAALATAPASAPTASAPPVASSDAAARRVPTGVGAVDAAPVARAAVDAPAAVRVPSVGLDLGVVPVGVRADGQMDVPELVQQLGWYRFGPAPGADAGSAVLAAHVDSDVGAAPMAAVLGAAEGDAVEVTTASGAQLRFRITAIEQISKQELPLDALFERDGEHVLRLVTCGGEWDPEARAYADNIVVTASPEGP